MAVFSHYAVQKAVYNLLNADAELMDKVEGVFDFVPAQSEYPYITIGDLRASADSTVTAQAVRMKLTLHVYSRARGRKEACEIMERAQAVLHGATPVAEDHTIVDMRYLGSDIALERDGLSYHGRMQFGVIAQENG